MSRFLQLRLLWRRATAHPGFTLVALATLAVGIGANVAIFTVVNTVLLRPLPIPDSERLVMLRHAAPGLTQLDELPLSDALYFFHAEESRTLDSVAVFRDLQASFTGPENPQRVQAARVTASFFDVMRTLPRIGRAFTLEDDRPGAAPVAVLADGLWRTRFGADPDVVGTVVDIDGASVEVVGVMPPGFSFSRPNAELWMPIALDRVQEVPADAPGATGPTVALITLAIATAMALRASGAWRLWSPLIGIAVGTVVAALFGAYDPQPLLDAAWAGIPDGSGFPGFDFTPGAEFWALLPVFVVITLVGGIKNIGDSVAMQGASRRRPRVTDFRLVQGSLNTNGLGILLSGFAGTPPTTVFSSTSVSLASLTGVASRNVGYVIGAAFVVLALFPKLPALILTIPNPVMGAFLLTAIALLFVAGVRTVIQDGLDARKMLVVGIAFSLGAGIETQTIFDDLIGGTWGRLLDNGLLIGAVAAVVMTLFLDLTSPRTGGRLQSKLHNDSLAEIDAFVREIAGSLGWNEDSTERLRSAAEETLMSLLPEGDDGEAEEAPRLIVVARPETGTVEMEFLAVFDEENLEDRLAYLEEESEGLQEGEISLRLLRHYASSVHHQKYYGLDIVTVQVKGSR